MHRIAVISFGSVVENIDYRLKIDMFRALSRIIHRQT